MDQRPGGEGITGGWAVRAEAVWSDLDLAFPLPAEHRRRVVVDGLMLSGRGRHAQTLGAWFPGKWYGLVWVPLRDGDGDIRLTLDDPFMPAAAL